MFLSFLQKIDSLKSRLAKISECKYVKGAIVYILQKSKVFVSYVARILW